MASDKFAARLNEQIGHEFAAHQQYVACAIHYDALTMPRMAAFFYRQALEERDHAMMMVQFLLDTGAQVEIPGVPAPTSSFPDAVQPVALALEQEKRVSTQVNELVALAREDHDYAAENFMQWFVKEQVEEVSTMSDLLTVANRAGGDLASIEEYVAREHAGGATADATAPPIAGG